MKTTLTSKGRIVIPSSIRRKLGINQGTRVLIDLSTDEREIILTPITRKYVHQLRGTLKGKGLLKALMTEKESEPQL